MIIMRYLTWDKLHQLLMLRSLRFTRVRNLMKSGHWDEGKLSLSTQKEIIKDSASRIEEIRKDGGDVSHFSINSDPLRVDDLVYVNSWTKNTEESKDMWKNYAADDGVIIKSTVDKLAEVTKNDRFLVYCKEVIYTDDNIMDSPQLPPIKYTKKDSKSIKDNEFRAFILDTNQGDYIDIPVNLNGLIDTVIVHPNNDFRVIEEILAENNIDASVKRSRFETIS
jgi:hypothetical protein